MLLSAEEYEEFCSLLAPFLSRMAGKGLTTLVVNHDYLSRTTGQTVGFAVVAGTGSARDAVYEAGQAIVNAVRDRDEGDGRRLRDN